jgi:hypothetical protein
MSQSSLADGRTDRTEDVTALTQQKANGGTADPSTSVGMTRCRGANYLDIRVEFKITELRQNRG